MNMNGSHSRRLLLQAGLALAFPAGAASALRVGPSRDIKTLAEASRRARESDVIEVDAGEYLADVAIWPHNGISLRAVGGRVRLVAAGSSAEGKAIFVMRGANQSIEGFDFIGCRVPDQNGAGIRFEAGSLKVRNCSFHDNENGILTSNNAEARLEIEDCEFGSIVRHEGQNHNLYVGRIAMFAITGSWFHHGQSGHMLKSRAAVNRIVCNRISDAGGHASIELEFPNGGLCQVIGNILEKGRSPENPKLISYGGEGKVWPRNELYLAHNTMDARSAGLWLASVPWCERTLLFNNLLMGNPYVGSQDLWPQWNEKFGNYVVDAASVTPDLALLPRSSLRGKAVRIEDAELQLTRQYRAPQGTVAIAGKARNPGAAQ